MKTLLAIIVLSLIGTAILLEFGHHNFEGELYMLTFKVIFISVPMMFWGFVHKRMFFIGLAITLSAVISLLTAGGISDLKEDQSAENAKQIVKALNDYNADNGAYPVNLNELVPSYLNTIPLTAIGISEHPFSYRQLAGSYLLSFPESWGYDIRILGDKRINPCEPVGC